MGAVFGDDLKTWADKVYPELPEEAKERYALNQYLTQLDNPQVALSVKQTKPSTVDDAVRSTLEMESYLKPPTSKVVAQVKEDDSEPVASVNVSHAMKQILESMDRIKMQ